MSSLCFQDAVEKKKANEITEDEFLQALVNHCAGTRHGENEQGNNDANLTDVKDSVAFGYNINDSFTFAVSQWIYFNFGKPVEGIELCSLQTIRRIDICFRYYRDTGNIKRISV
jgi:hypothetical protein